jgi:hypothetical protein
MNGDIDDGWIRGWLQSFVEEHGLEKVSRMDSKRCHKFLGTTKRNNRIYCLELEFAIYNWWRLTSCLVQMAPEEPPKLWNDQWDF